MGSIQILLLFLKEYDDVSEKTSTLPPFFEPFCQVVMETVTGKENYKSFKLLCKLVAIVPATCPGIVALYEQQIAAVLSIEFSKLQSEKQAETTYLLSKLFKSI